MSLKKPEIVQLRGGGAILVSTRVFLTGRALHGLVISREDQVCFVVLSVHWVTVPGVTQVVQPTGLRGGVANTVDFSIGQL